jgi:hypothetical protein
LKFNKVTQAQLMDKFGRLLNKNFVQEGLNYKEYQELDRDNDPPKLPNIYGMID